MSTKTATKKKATPKNISDVLRLLSTPAALERFRALAADPSSLSQADQKRITQFQAAIIGDARYVVSRPALAELLEVTTKTVDRMAKRGMPKAPAGYDLREVALWLYHRIDEVKHEAVSANAMKQREQKATTLLKELKLDEARGLLMSRDVFEATLTQRAAMFRSELLALPTRCAPRCANRSAEEVVEVLHDAAGDVLERLLSKDANARRRKKN